MLTKNDLQQIRSIVREEVSSEVKNQFKEPNKNIETIQQNVRGLSQELKEAREDIKSVDLKVELVSKKVDVLREDTAKGFVNMVDAMEENYKELNVRTGKLEEHSAIPHP